MPREKYLGIKRHDQDDDVVCILQSVVDSAGETGFVHISPAVLRHAVCVACFTVVRCQVRHAKVH